MEVKEDIVIVGAGIAGLATALGLHRLGVESLVLESADSLRIAGFALGLWTNAWKAIDALGIGEILREKNCRLNGAVTTSIGSGNTISELSFRAANHSQVDHEARCVRRNLLLETLVNELPKGAIRYSSKVVSIETDGYFKSIHLADGTVVKAKVLIGCDGVNSMVAKFLGFSKPPFVGRSAVRAVLTFEDGHGFEPRQMHFVGKGVRYGIAPLDDYSVYWFFAFHQLEAEGIDEDLKKLKQFVLSQLGKVPDKIKEVFEKTKEENMVCASLRSRPPWQLLLGNISKDNVCVAGDALHPMTPDLGQGGCAALEDAVVLARVLAEALKEKPPNEEKQENYEAKEHLRIKKGLEKFARERKWRCFDLISSSYLTGSMQQSDSVVLNFIRDKILAKLIPWMLLEKASFDCGKLTAS